MGKIWWNLGGGLSYLPRKHRKFRGEFRGKFRSKFRRKFRKLRLKFRDFFSETSFSRRAVLTNCRFFFRPILHFFTRYCAFWAVCLSPSLAVCFARFACWHLAAAVLDSPEKLSDFHSLFHCVILSISICFVTSWFLLVISSLFSSPLLFSSLLFSSRPFSSLSLLLCSLALSLYVFIFLPVCLCSFRGRCHVAFSLYIYIYTHIRVP